MAVGDNYKDDEETDRIFVTFRHSHSCMGSIGRVNKKERGDG